MTQAEPGKNVSATDPSPMRGECFASGHYSRSGSYGSGSAGLTEIFGDGWEEAAAKGFLLAPQVYLLDVAERSGGSTAGLDPGLSRSLDVLPVRLTFHETANSLSGAVCQSWSSADRDSWAWLLTVESLEGALIGVVSATPPGRRREILRWRSRERWNFFGGNKVSPHGRRRPLLNTELCVSVP